MHAVGAACVTEHVTVHLGGTACSCRTQRHASATQHRYPGDGHGGRFCARPRVGRPAPHPAVLRSHAHARFWRRLADARLLLDERWLQRRDCVGPSRYSNISGVEMWSPASEASTVTTWSNVFGSYGGSRPVNGQDEGRGCNVTVDGGGIYG